MVCIPYGSLQVSLQSVTICNVIYAFCVGVLPTLYTTRSLCERLEPKLAPHREYTSNVSLRYRDDTGLPYVAPSHVY